MCVWMHRKKEQEWAHVNEKEGKERKEGGGGAVKKKRKKKE